jgi:hypothetical protein
LTVTGGKLLLQEEFLQGLFREEDREQGLAYSRSPDTFQVILTTQFSPEDFEDFLFANDWGLPKPKEQYQFIVIEANDAMEHAQETAF